MPLRDVIVVVTEMKCDGLDSRLSSSAVLPVELNQLLLPACQMLDRTAELEPASGSILSAPFPGAHC